MASSASMVASVIARAASSSSSPLLLRESVHLARGSGRVLVGRRHVAVGSLSQGQSRDLFAQLDSRPSLRGQTFVVPSAFNSTDASNKDAKSSDQKPADADASKDLSETEKKLQEETAELRAKHDDLMDKYRRSLAESDNMRKRLTKQIDDAKIFGIQGFCKDLLEVADVLGKAIETVPEDSLKESQHVRDMFEGLKLTQTQLHQVFKRHGLEKEDPINQKFDPNKHEALFQIPAPDKEPNLVLDVQKVGYLLHGRTIRPALVGVSKK